MSIFPAAMGGLLAKFSPIKEDAIAELIGFGVVGSDTHVDQSVQLPSTSFVADIDSRTEGVALVATLLNYDASLAAITCTVGGVPMTLIRQDDGDGTGGTTSSSILFYLDSPPLGSQTVIVDAGAESVASYEVTTYYYRGEPSMGVHAGFGREGSDAKADNEMVINYTPATNTQMRFGASQFGRQSAYDAISGPDTGYSLKSGMELGGTGSGKFNSLTAQACIESTDTDPKTDTWVAEVGAGANGSYSQTALAFCIEGNAVFSPFSVLSNFLDSSSNEFLNVTAFNFTDNFAWGGWFNVDASSDDTLIGKWLSSLGSRSYEIIHDPTNGFVARTSTNGDAIDVTVNSGVVSSGWHFVVGVVESGDLKLYVDKILTGTVTTSGAVFASGVDFTIGADGAGSNRMAGSLTACFVADNALIQSDIDNLFGGSKVSKCFMDVPTMTMDKMLSYWHNATGIPGDILLPHEDQLGNHDLTPATLNVFKPQGLDMECTP